MPNKTIGIESAMKDRLSTRGFSHKDDGSTHINVYSMAKTELGRMLSHFDYFQFTHPYFGPFYSMEGFWYFMRGGKVDDSLRYLYGRKAKSVGRKSPPKWYPEFKEDILAGNYQKIIQNKELHDLLKESTLPLDHYYVFRDRNDVDFLINPVDTEWLTKGLEEIREALKAGEVPKCWISAEERYKRG